MQDLHAISISAMLSRCADHRKPGQLVLPPPHIISQLPSAMAMSEIQDSSAQRKMCNIVADRCVFEKVLHGRVSRHRTDVTVSPACGRHISHRGCDMPDALIGLEAAALISIIVESILYGFSVFTFGITAWMLVYVRPMERVNYLMCVVTSLLFILSTMHIAVDARHVYTDFVGPGASQDNRFDSTKDTLKNAIHQCEILLADAVLIYRCYALWKNIWVIVPSILGWCAVFTTGALSTWTMSWAASTPADDFAYSRAKWFISYTALALATNLITTSLLAFKLWRVNQATTCNALQPVVRIVLECGVLYSLALLVSIITYRVHTNDTFLVIDVIGQIIPITFYLIILFASMALIPGKSGATSDTEPTSVLPMSVPSGESCRLLSQIKVHVTRCIDHDSTTSPASSGKAMRGC